MAEKKRGGSRAVGRPALPVAQRQGIVPVRMPGELLSEVDAIVEARLDRPNRSSVIRELVAEAIASRKGKRK